MPELASTFSLEVPGTVAVAAGVDRWVADFRGSIDAATATVGTAPTGAAIIVDVLKNGVSVYTDTTQRPTIAVGASTSQVPAGRVGSLGTLDLQQTRGATAQNAETPTTTPTGTPVGPGGAPFVPGDVITLSVVQVGSTVAGAALEVSVAYSAA